MRRLEAPAAGYVSHMMNPRPMGILFVLIGGVGAAIAALADPLGIAINAAHTFGWLQIAGVIVGGVVALLGLVIAAEWVPVPGAAGSSAGTTAAPQTTVVTGSSRRRRTA
jgi:uncharacterized membrane protein